MIGASLIIDQIRIKTAAAMRTIFKARRVSLSLSIALLLCYALGLLYHKEEPKKSLSGQRICIIKVEK